jgi:aminopeptidase N
MVLTSVFLLAIAHGQFGGKSAFTPPRASLHYAPDRTCDLLNVAVDLNVDYANRAISGHVVNTMSPLRSGLTEVMLMAGQDLTITNVTVNGETAQYRRDGESLYITTPPTVRGKVIKIGIDYHGEHTKANAFGGDGGFHWIEPRQGIADREGFWTQGEAVSNRNWVPTWDYPNDLATSETRTTVPANWDVIGNGILVSNKLSADKKTRTFDWKMTLPHATYLLSLAGGPLDIVHDNWEGVQLWYVVPKGEGKYAAETFADTKDMLSFYSKTLGVKYAWPKYAQDMMYDFGGGMENVSATTLGAGSIIEKRQGYQSIDSLTSHELAHQWFGDYVTCKDWGDTWLNESFATFIQTLYFEHRFGPNAYNREVDNNTRTYLFEARRYKRPISTKMYESPDSMFDSHTYPKGGTVLHTLRRMLGDEAFFAGLNYYLHRHAHEPVESGDLRRSMTEATGINCEPFWAQWFDKPGHPVLDYTWDYDSATSEVELHVKQTQDTSDGTPIYDIAAKVGVFNSPDSGPTRLPVHLNAADQTFRIKVASAPAAVVLDPDHDFLREIPELHWSKDELKTILRSAPNGVDRTEAMKRLLANSPSDGDIALVANVVSTDTSADPSFGTIAPLIDLALPSLRSFFLGQLESKDIARRTEAVNGLAKLPADPSTVQKIRTLINDQAPINVVVASIAALRKWDAKGNADIFTAATKIPSRFDRIKHAAENALEDAKAN